MIDLVWLILMTLHLLSCPPPPPPSARWESVNFVVVKVEGDIQSGSGNTGGESWAIFAVAPGPDGDITWSGLTWEIGLVT